MAGFLGMIGTLPFVCSHEKVMTFSNLQTEQSVRYAMHEVIGKKPVLCIGCFPNQKDCSRSA